MSENKEIMIKITGLKKRYRLGTIGGGTLSADLQSWWARIRHKEDPNAKIGAKTYGKNETFMALNGIDLTVCKGERVGIIGHNGAGKSTLLKLLSRVTGPTEGEICLNGRIASMLEVGTGFNPELTGRENIYLNGAILGMTKAEVDTKIDDIIEFSEVAKFIDTPVKRYSSGMYVKLAFSVAAHLDSEIMIMDEVLAVGDMKFQQKCLNKMSEVSKSEGRTVLYVSHNMNTIRQLCDRCVVLDKGTVIYDGEVEGGIEKYLENAGTEMNVRMDLSQSRMDHLPQEPPAKIQSLVLTDKEAPIYSFREDIVFDLGLNSFINIEKACLRLEIRQFDDTPVGISYNHDIGGFKKDESYSIQVRLKEPRLVEGRYKALLVLYEINNFGGYNDLDAVYPAFIFDVLDSREELKIRWNKRAWGRICFEQLECNRKDS